MEVMFEDMDVHLVKIAALDSHLIGLTNRGHVLKILIQTIDIARLEGWVFLSFRSRKKSSNVSPSAAPDSPSLQELQDIRITHVTAQFETFVAYSTGSSSVVLMGTHETDPNTEPRVVPALQNINVISVILGDYHHGALTSTGKLLTWGQYSNGALGLGDPTKIEPGQPGGYRTEQQRQHGLQFRSPPPAVTDPAEVRFDHGERRNRKRFCFAATSAGWHMGALVIDLEPDDPDEEGSVSMPGGFPPGPEPSERTPTNPPGSSGIPRLSIFRVGFAGRGSTRGFPHGRRGG
ncbi:hypothetical protein JVU11DRAFT_6460 [Chiua virens]|nr:hypothetical protein JVU11DRAFT_6460 [Chiua virens]